ncbi:MAG: ATP-binding protein, partial [Magnetospirillum sp.]|nr:ATP-binding protein [Magnetospirillum sp.]
HGNLGLASDLRHSLAGLAEFNQRIAKSVADPTMAARRVRLTAWPMGQGVEVRVSDDGDGYDLDAELAKPVDVAAKSGRGLGLIRKVSNEVRGEDGGRTLCMRFNPAD